MKSQVIHFFFRFAMLNLRNLGYSKVLVVYFDQKVHKNYCQESTMEQRSISNALALLVLLLCCLIIYAIYDLCLKAKILRAKLRRQGIDGPRPSLILGNVPDIQKIESKELDSDASTSNLNEPLSLDCRSVLLPHISQWTNQYGMYIIDSRLIRNKHFSLNICC